MIDVFLLIINFLSLISFVYILFILINPPKIKKEKFDKDYFPFVSIIVPAINEEEVIERTLKKLISVDYPKKKKEIIVVSDSTDRTNEICEKYKKFVKLIKHSHREGKWKALNEGIRKAKGEIILTTDADVIVPKDWIKKLVRPFQDKTIKLTWGPGRIKNPNFNFLTKAQTFFIDLDNIAAKISQQLEVRYAGSGSNMAFRKSVWKKYKFRNEVTEDSDFAYRIFKNGMKGYFVENAQVKIRVPLNLSDLRSQQIRWLHESHLDLKLFLLWILFISTYLFPTLGLMTLIYLIFIKNSLLLSLFVLNIVLFVISYVLICLRTSTKNLMNGLHLISLNLFYFLFVIEAIVRMLFNSKIEWKEYKY